MGLDTVELVLAFEEEFGIEIDNAAAEKMRTPGDVIDFIAAQCNGKERCTSQAGFHQFRHVCVNALGRARKEVRPGTTLVSVLPAEDVRSAWLKLGETMAIPARSWPRLAYPSEIRYRRQAGFMLLILGVPGLLMVTTREPAVLLIALLVSACVTAWLAARLERCTSHLRTVIPDHLSTVGKLIKATIPAEWVKAEGVATAWGRARIARRVKEIVIMQLGIAESAYCEDARFVEDFGAD